MKNFSLIILISVILFCFSCGSRDHVVSQTDADVVKASRLLFDKHDEMTVVTVIDPWQNSSGTKLVYYFLPYGSPLPSGFSEEQIIRVPVRRIICMSTTHIAMLRALGAENELIGISGPGLVYDSIILDRIKKGSISDVGYEGNLNSELIVSLKPDLLIAYGVTEPSGGQMGKLTSAGIKVLYDADYLEEHPLARCEWIRLFGLLTGREAKADSIYRSASEAYLSLTQEIKSKIRKHPKVLLGYPWEDVWYISPSNSYTGRLVADAGGDYLFSDLSGPHSVPYSIEAVFRRAMEADVWINPGTADNLSEITAADQRMALLPVFIKGGVWNNRNRVTSQGGNDYWESTVVRPDLLLEDIVSIIHPELLPDHNQIYYRRLK